MKYLKSFKFWIVFFVFGYTLLGFIGIPWFITEKLPNILQKNLGLHVEIKEAKFNPYNFNLTLKEINLLEQNKKSVLKLKKIFIDFVPLGLFDKTILFRDIIIDSPKILTTIEKDGTLNLNKILPPNKKQKSDEKKTKTDTPAIIIQKFQIKNGNLLFSDLRGDNFTLEFGPYNFKAHDISTKKGDLNAHTFKTKIDKNAQLFWEGGMRLEPLSLYGEITLKNLELPKLYQYTLKDFNVILNNGKLSLKIPYQIDLSKELSLQINGADIDLFNLTLQNKKTNRSIIDLPQIAFKNINLKYPEQAVTLEKITIKKPSVFTLLDKDYTLNLVKAFEMPKKEDTKSKEGKPWRYELNHIHVEDGFIIFIDSTLNQPIKNELSSLMIDITDITSNKEKPVSYSLNTKLNQDTKLKADGKFVQKEMTLSSDINLEDFRIEKFKEHLKPYVNFNLKSASLYTNSHIKANFKDKLSLHVEANSNIKNLYIEKDKEKFLSWEELKVGNLKFNLNPLSIDIKSVNIYKPYIRAHIAKDGTTNFSNLTKKRKSTQEKTKKDSKEPLNLKIGTIKLVDGTSDFSDFSLPFPFKTHIHELEGKFSTLDFTTTSPSLLDLKGKIDKYGYTDIKGILYPLDIKENAELNLLFKNIDLNSMTPYSGKFLGYTIKEGKLSMDLKYTIKKAKLIGDNKINIDTLNLGEKVDSPDAPNLPLELAIALLKDSNGQIDLNLPVSGDMNNPEFSYGSVIWRAIGNMITGIVTAPFRFLGNVLGINTDDLKSIDFDKGSYEIISTEHEKFANLQKIMQSRPNIKLNIYGAYDEVADVKVLQIEEFKAIVKKEAKDKNIDKNKKKFDIINFNTTLQNRLIKHIKIPKQKLEKLAIKRAENIKNTLTKEYKIDPLRLNIKEIKVKEAKRDRWIECDLEIAL